MVKLLRLTSTNDCKFEADLDAGISVGENASIGLQNLTFESSNFTTFSITGDKSIVSFSLNNNGAPTDNAPDFNFLTSFLQSKDYTALTINDFWADLEATLNECLEMNNAGGTGSAYASFRVVFPDETNDLEKVIIIFKLTPMIMLFNNMETRTPRNGRMVLFQSSTNGREAGDLEIDVGASLVENLGNISLHASLNSTLSRQHFVYPRENSFGNSTEFEAITWSKGSGMFACRINNLADNGDAANTNGFSIGFTNKNIQVSTDSGTTFIPSPDIFFEVRVQRPTDNITYQTPDAGPTDSGLAPSKFLNNATFLENDHIVFERNGKNIFCRVKQSDPKTDNFIFSYELSREQMKEDLYPFICVFGDNANCQVGFPNITIQPIINPFDSDGSRFNNDKNLITGDSQVLKRNPEENYFQIMKANGFDGIVPEPDNAFWDGENGVYTGTNPNLKLNGSILRLMGFDYTTFPNNLEYVIQRPTTLIEYDGPFCRQFNLIPDGLVDLTNSDNYIVLLDSNPLFSYDASKFDYTDQTTTNLNINNIKRGRRKNILATLPVNNNNGIVEYRANDPIYIDLDNQYPQVIKNLRLRVLNKNFDVVETRGQSVMTLLLKDK